MNLQECIGCGKILFDEEEDSVCDSCYAYSKECRHEYETYIGLVETFQYCKKCDNKKYD